MNYISLLGLLTLIGCAWAISVYRTDIKIKPIIWGISLQLIFALIILRQDYMSFIGMSILGTLLILYNHSNEKQSGENVLLSLLIIGIALSSGYLLTIFPKIAYLVMLTSIFAIIINRLILRKSYPSQK